MKIKNVIFKENGQKLIADGCSIRQFHKLINDLNRLNPDNKFVITISYTH